MSGAIGFASRGMVQVMLFGVTVVATRVLPVAEFGAYALGSLLLVGGASCSTWGLTNIC